MTFGEYLKSLRAKEGLSQRDLAEKAKVSNAEISRLETGERKKPSPNSLKLLAPHLNVRYEDLMEKAGYIESIISMETHEDVIWKNRDGSYVDTYRRQIDNILNKDKDLISILDRAVDKTSEKDIDTIKKLLSNFIDDGLTEEQKITLRTIIDGFSNKK